MRKPLQSLIHVYTASDSSFVDIEKVLKNKMWLIVDYNDQNSNLEKVLYFQSWKCSISKL